MSYDAWLRGASERLGQLDPGFAVMAGRLDVSTLPSGRTGLAIERVMLLETLAQESKRLTEVTPAQHLDLQYFEQCVALERFVQLEIGERLHNPDVLSALGDLLMTVLCAPYDTEEERFDRLTSLLNGVEGYLAEAVTTFGDPDPLWLDIAAEVAEGFSDLFDALPAAARGRATLATSERLQQVVERGRAALLGFVKQLRAMRGRHLVHVLGSDRYGELVKLKGYPFSPLELLELGVEKLARLKEQSKQAARAVSFMGDDKAALKAVRSSYPPTFDEALAEVRRLSREARDFAYEHELVRPPRQDELWVIETPSFARPLTPVAAIATARAYWPLQRSIYYVTRGESLADLHYASLRNVVPHEAYPGHHLQYAVANERGSLLRNLPWNTQRSAAMGVDTVEGWAHYCEALMKRAGFYSGPAESFYALHLAVLRAARVVVDVSLQLGRLSLESAMQKLVDEVGLSPAHARAEVRSSALNPGYNLGYGVGKHLIKAMRGEVEKACGRSLKDADYHELIMTNGQAPLSLVVKRAALR